MMTLEDKIKLLNAVKDPRFPVPVDAVKAARVLTQYPDQVGLFVCLFFLGGVCNRTGLTPDEIASAIRDINAKMSQPQSPIIRV